MAQIQIREALRQAMQEEMRRDDSIFLMGEEVAYYNGAYKVSPLRNQKISPAGPPLIRQTTLAPHLCMQ